MRQERLVPKVQTTERRQPLPPFWRDVENLRKAAEFKRGAFRVEGAVKLPDSKKSICSLSENSCPPDFHFAQYVIYKRSEKETIFRLEEKFVPDGKQDDRNSRTKSFNTETIEFLIPHDRYGSINWDDLKLTIASEIHNANGELNFIDIFQKNPEGLYVQVNPYGNESPLSQEFFDKIIRRNLGLIRRALDKIPMA